MDEYITRSEFDRLLKEEVRRQLQEQKTEEMKAIRVDVHNVDVEAIKQELHTVSNTWLETLQDHYNEHKQDISDVQTVLSGHSKFFEEHGRRLAHIEANMDKQGQRQDTMDSKLDQILQLLQQKSGE